MAEARQVRPAPGGGDALRCAVDFQARAQSSSIWLGGVGPQCLVRVGRHDDVLQAPHGGHEPAQLGAGVDGLDLGEAPCSRWSVSVTAFHTSIRSSVVVMVASSDSMLSMTVFA